MHFARTTEAQRKWRSVFSSLRRSASSAVRYLAVLLAAGSRKSSEVQMASWPNTGRVARKVAAVTDGGDGPYDWRGGLVAKLWVSKDRAK